MHHIVYLHGFNSSPASVKASQTAAWLYARGLDAYWHCPPLPYSPANAADQIADLISALGDQPFICVGSSLGGFYATWAAEQFGCRAVLINPGVKPQNRLHQYLGLNRNLYTGEEYVLTERHMAELDTLEQHQITPSRYWLLVETGDELLDYRDAVGLYAGAKQTVIEGGDHSFSHWPDYLPLVMAWAGIGTV